MKKWMLAPITLLLAGASALPAWADDDDRREQRREWREEREEDRRDWRADRREDHEEEDEEEHRDWRAGRRDDRRDDRRWSDRYGWRVGHDGDHHGYRHDYRHDYRGDWRDDRREWREVRYSRHRDYRWDRWYWAPQYRYHAPVRYVYPRGYGYYGWRVGHRLPPPLYARHYYVDYRYYRLPPPPYGHVWVRVDRDVVLVALGTGLILDVFYGLFH